MLSSLRFFSNFFASSPRVMSQENFKLSKCLSNFIAIGGLYMSHQKYDYANHDRFVPNFDMAYKTVRLVPVPNLKSFRPTRTELPAKEVGQFSIMVYGKMGWGRSIAHQHGCCKINVWRSSEI